MSIVNSIRARRQLKMRQRHPEQPGLRKEQKIQENKGYYPTLKQTCARIFYTFCVPLAFFQLIYLGVIHRTDEIPFFTYEMHSHRMVTQIWNLESRIANQWASRQSNLHCRCKALLAALHFFHVSKNVFPLLLTIKKSNWTRIVWTKGQSHNH